MNKTTRLLPLVVAIALALIVGFAAGRASNHAPRHTCRLFINEDGGRFGPVVTVDEHTAIIDKDTNTCVRS